MNAINIEEPSVIEHPTTAPASRMLRWIAVVAILVVAALGVSLWVDSHPKQAALVAKRNAPHSAIQPMMAPPPRWVAP